MKEDIKAQWTAALRSGEYEQGRGALVYDGEFCCLGVLCELAHEAGAVTRRVSGAGCYTYGNSDAVLPPEVMEWSGVDHEAGKLSAIESGNGKSTFLSELNDVQLLNFKQIADVIDYAL